MGIRFSDSILTLLAAALGVATAYFVGHGLSEMTAWPWITAGVCLLAAFAVGAFTVRRLKAYGADRDGSRAH
jgi:uncharacterized membrane protein (DUF441 family)